MPSAAAMRTGARRLMPFDRFAAQHGARNPITDTSLTGREAVKALLTVNNPGGLGEPEGFSYVREIQPILDKHCVRCHTGDKTEGRPGRAVQPPGRRAAVLVYAVPQQRRQDPGRAARLHGVLPEPDAVRARRRAGELDQRSNPPHAAAALCCRCGHQQADAASRAFPQRRSGVAGRETAHRLLDRPLRPVLRLVHRREPVGAAGEGDLPVLRGQAGPVWRRSRSTTSASSQAARTQGKTFAPEDFQVFDQGGPEARRRFEQAWLELNRNRSTFFRPASGKAVECLFHQASQREILCRCGPVNLSRP
jgi:hypothetical protein